MPPENQISPIEQIYTVVPNDSLSKIASLYDISVDVLIAYNGWTDGIGHLLLAGDEILIPPETPIPSADGPAAGDPGSTDSADPADEPACRHIIVAGENPTKVARKYGLTFDELQLANPFMDFRTTFVVGDTLNIPPEGTC